LSERDDIGKGKVPGLKMLGHLFTTRSSSGEKEGRED